MRANLLNVCGAFILPYAPRSPGEPQQFPGRTLVKEMLTLLDKLVVTSEDIENCAGENNVLKVISGLPNYGADIDQLRHDLLQKWERTVVVDEVDSEADSEDDDKGAQRRHRPLFDRETLKQEKKELTAERHMGVPNRLDANLSRSMRKYRRARGVNPPTDFVAPQRFVEVPKTHAKRKPHNA
jgi:hypothetical protein